ncbi:MAG: zinc ribbon domain-containing protein [Polyangiaceae bacterium]
MTYEYACEACGHTWEAEQRIKDAPLKECASCGAPKAKRLISGGTGFLLKGGGWYADGYGSAAPSKSSGDSDSAGSASAKSASGDSASKESSSKDSPSKDSAGKEAGSKEAGSKKAESTASESKAGDAGSKSSGDSGKTASAS